MTPHSMLAAVYRGPHDIRVEDRPVPMTGPGEALVKVERAGICGTDLRIFHGAHSRYPPGTVRVPGHEAVGTVEQLGPGVEGLTLGQTVSVAPNIGCGRCRHCVLGHPNLCLEFSAIGVTMDGAFAEYLHVTADAVSRGNLIGLDGDTDLSAAALIEPLACVLRGQDAVAVRAGDVVLVMGAGPIGIMHLLLAKSIGARLIVTEVIPERLAFAKSLGADRVVNPQTENLAAAVADETGGNGADVIVVAAPVGALQISAVGLAAPGGRINFFGGLPADQSSINIDSNLIHYRELRVTGTTACNTQDCRRAAAMVESGSIDLRVLVGGTYPLAKIQEALEATEGKKALKILIEPFPRGTEEI